MTNVKYYREMEKMNRGLSIFIMAFMVCVLNKCGPSRPAMKEFAFPKSKYSDWARVFENPVNIRIESLSTSIMRAQRSGILNLENPRAAGLRDGTLRLPVFAHLLRHEKYGDYLVDAGIPVKESLPDNDGEKGEFEGDDIRMGETDWGTGSRLASLNAHPKAVFFTHLHLDHSMGIADLPSTTTLVFGARESTEPYNILNSREDLKKYLKGIKIVYTINFSQAATMPPCGPCADLLGDGSLWAISTPGHSAGHISYLVNGTAGPVLITGDACVVRWGFENDVEPGYYSSDIETSRKSLKMLREFCSTYPRIRIIFGHEL